MTKFIPPTKRLSRLYKAEFQAWVDLRKRCRDRDNPRFADYGGRGIKVCLRWLTSFRNFLSDVGPRPSPNHQIDRINNDGHYEPSNVRWATRSQQQRNKRPSKGGIRKVELNLTLNDETLHIIEWARRLGVTTDCIKGRLKRGWTIKEALTTKEMRDFHTDAKTVTINGVTKRIKEWAEEKGIRLGLIYERVKTGWSLERAITTPARKYGGRE